MRPIREPPLWHFNPRAPYGARLCGLLTIAFIVLFQSTRPIRGATELDRRDAARERFQSTRPIRGATHRLRGSAAGVDISIHAPHTGRDARVFLQTLSEVISIHAPHTGRDATMTILCTFGSVFQSTRPIRGATRSRTRSSTASRNFNPRAPYGARLCLLPWVSSFTCYFNPRAPYGARHEWADKHRRLSPISIHAPHTGRDLML